MNTNTVLKLLALVLLLGLGIFFLLGKDGDAAANDGRVGAPDPVAPTHAADLAPVAEADRPEVASTERIEAAPSLAPTKLAPWAGELAGLSGRVVESDGTPVVGIRVALLEFDTEMLFTGGHEPGQQAASLELEETLTDAEGRFVLGGARAPAFHGLGVDLGGPRSTLRVLDTALVHRERTDVGDVVLAPYGILSGRVVDEQGAGISGARVRVGPFPVEVLMGAPYELRGESLVAISMMLSAGDSRGVIEPPRWIRSTLDELPIPTTTTDSTGAFRLEGVALAEIVGGIDKPGYASLPLGPIDMRAGLAGVGEHDVGKLVMTRGRTIEGVVEDAEGDPVVGVEVYAGAEVPAGFVAILQPCGKSDAEGRFALRGVAAEGQVVAIARRSKSEPWASEVTTRHDDMLLALESAIELTVRVKNEAEEPVSGARIELEPALKTAERGMFGLGEIAQFLPRDVDPQNGFREVEPGRYVNPSVTAGAYEVTAHVRGLAVGTTSAELWDEESEVVVTCPTGRHIELAVIDALTLEPIARANASLMRAGQVGLARLGAGITDAAGRTRLGPLADVGSDSAEGQTLVIVRHPRYADHTLVIDPTTFHSGAEIPVALVGGGTLAGRVHWGGEVPTRAYMLVLEYRGADGFVEVFHMPRLGLSDLTGAFRIANLVAGDYRVELLERFLDQDPVGLMTGKFEPASLFSETVTIAAGETTELVIDLTPTGRGPTARIRGRVRVDGREIEGAEVTVRGNGMVSTTTDAWGRFETEDFTVWGNVWVSIEGEVPMPAGGTGRMQIYQENLELKEGELREIDVDLVPVALHVEVVAAGNGDPIPGAEVSARPTGDRRKSARGFESLTTDAAGEVALWVTEPGDYQLTAEATGFASARTQVTASPSGGERTRLELARSVPCAGRVSVPASSAAAQSFSYVSVRREDNAHSNGMMISGPDYAFDLDGLSPGSYRAYLYINGRVGQQATFELGPDGDRDLVLDYVPEEPSGND